MISLLKTNIIKATVTITQFSVRVSSFLTLRQLFHKLNFFSEGWWKGFEVKADSMAIVSVEVIGS